MNNSKLIITIVCLLLTSFLIYRASDSDVEKKVESLDNILSDIEGWIPSGRVPLNERIVEELLLDDYVNLNYTKGNEVISLYIGYYFSSKKVGAAHDPLVCFPGQGWDISDINKGELILNRTAGESISFSTMVAEKGKEKQLVLYWFQSYDHTNHNTLFQKICSAWIKMLKNKEDNAFVRLSIPMKERSLPECLEVLNNFQRNFYPVFLKYIKS